MTNYSRGAAFERRIKKDLEKRGYYAIRSAGSHGLIDIAAFKGDIVLFGKYAGTDVRIGDVEYTIMRESDILAKEASRAKKK